MVQEWHAWRGDGGGAVTAMTMRSREGHEGEQQRQERLGGRGRGAGRGSAVCVAFKVASPWDRSTPKRATVIRNRESSGGEGTCPGGGIEHQQPREEVG